MSDTPAGTPRGSQSNGSTPPGGQGVPGSSRKLAQTETVISRKLEGHGAVLDSNAAPTVKALQNSRGDVSGMLANLKGQANQMRSDATAQRKQAFGVLDAEKDAIEAHADAGEKELNHTAAYKPMQSGDSMKSLAPKDVFGGRKPGDYSQDHKKSVSNGGSDTIVATIRPGTSSANNPNSASNSGGVRANRVLSGNGVGDGQIETQTSTTINDQNRQTRKISGQNTTGQNSDSEIVFADTSRALPANLRQYSEPVSGAPLTIVTGGGRREIANPVSKTDAQIRTPNNVKSVSPNFIPEDTRRAPISDTKQARSESKPTSATLSEEPPVSGTLKDALAPATALSAAPFVNSILKRSQNDQISARGLDPEADEIDKKIIEKVGASKLNYNPANDGSQDLRNNEKRSGLPLEDSDKILQDEDPQMKLQEKGNNTGYGNPYIKPSPESIKRNQEKKLRQTENQRENNLSDTLRVKEDAQSTDEDTVYGPGGSIVSGGGSGAAAGAGVIGIGGAALGAEANEAQDDANNAKTLMQQAREATPAKLRQNLENAKKGFENAKNLGKNIKNVAGAAKKAAAGARVAVQVIATGARFLIMFIAATWWLWLIIIVIILIVSLFAGVAGATGKQGGTDEALDGVSITVISPRSCLATDAELMPSIMRQITTTPGGEVVTANEATRQKYEKTGDVNNRNQTNSAKLAILAVEAASNLINSGEQKDTTNKFEPLQSRSLSYPYDTYRPQKKVDEKDKNQPLISKEAAQIIQYYLAKPTGKSTADGKEEDSAKSAKNIDDLTGYGFDETQVTIDGLKLGLKYDNQNTKYTGSLKKVYSAQTYKDDDAKVANINPVRGERRNESYESYGHAPLDRGSVPVEDSSIHFGSTSDERMKKMNFKVDAGDEDTLIDETFASYVKGGVTAKISAKGDDLAGALAAPLVNGLLDIVNGVIKDLLTISVATFPTYTNTYYDMENWRRKTEFSLQNFNPNNTPALARLNYKAIKDRSAVFAKAFNAVMKIFGLDINPAGNSSTQTGTSMQATGAGGNVTDDEKQKFDNINNDSSLTQDQKDKKIKELNEQIAVRILKDASQGGGIFAVFKKVFSAFGDLKDAFSGGLEEKPAYTGQTIDDIVAQSIQELKAINYNRSVQGANFNIALNVEVGYTITPPAVTRITVAPPDVTLNYAKKVIANGPGRPEVEKLMSRVQRAVIQAAADKGEAKAKNADTGKYDADIGDKTGWKQVEADRAYSEPVNISNGGAFQFGKEQVDLYQKQLDDFRGKCSRKEYTSNNDGAYGGIKSSNYTGAGSAQSWEKLTAVDKAKVTKLGFDTPQKYYEAMIVNEFASQGIRVDPGVASGTAQDAQNEKARKIIAYGLGLAKDNTDNFVNFRELNPQLDKLPDMPKNATDFADFFGKVLPGLFNSLTESIPKNPTGSALSTAGKTIASLAAAIAEKYGPLGKGAVVAGWKLLTELLKGISTFKIGDATLKLVGPAEDITRGMIDNFNLLSNGENLSVFSSDAENGKVYDGRGFLLKKFRGKQVYVKWSDPSLTGEDLVNNPNLIAQNQKEPANPALAAFILVRSVLNGDTDGTQLNLQNVNLVEEKTGLIAGQPENVKQFLEDYKKFVPQYKSKLTDDYIERALKSQMGELAKGKITNGQGCITNSFMNSTSNAKIYHTGNDINAAVGSEVYSLAEGDIIYARLNQSEGTQTLSGGNIIAIKSKNPTGNTDAIIHRYLHLSQTDILGLTSTYGSNGNPTNATNLVHVKAGQIIAKSGSSGTGKPHLHLDIIEMNETDKGLIEDMKAGTLVNPFRKSAPFLDIKNYGICANFFTMDQLTKYDDYQYNAPTIGTWRPVSRSWQHSPGSY